MFDIKEYDDKYKIYELIDSENKSYIKICPERGGIIIGFGVNETETLYLDKETFYDSTSNVRGGIPVLFPLCGQLPNGKYDLNGIEYPMKNHGLARINKWKVIKTSIDEGASISIQFESDANTKKSFPFDFNVIFKYTLSGNKLTIAQQFENKSDVIMPMSIGYHPYFIAKNKDDIFYDTNATEFLDHNDMKVKPVSPESLNISKSVESKLLLNHKGNSFTFKLNDLNRKFTFTYDDIFKYIVIWTVLDEDFVCVEPWSAKNSSLYTKKDLIYVNPKEKLNYSVSLTVEL